MKHFNDYLGRDPLVYVRELMRHFDFKTPPIPVEDISDYLGLSIEEVAPAREQTTPELHKTLSTVSCWLERDKKRIQVYKWAARKRKRLGIGHENTHFIIPYHEGINPFCAGVDDPTTRKHTEREAFLGGAAMLFYPKLFIKDLRGLTRHGLSEIEQLAERYDASLEATAIWYAQTHPAICAVLVADLPQDKIATDSNLYQPMLPRLGKINRPKPDDKPIWLPVSGRLDEPSSTLEIRYSVRSNRFPKWLGVGTRIPDTCIIYQAFHSKKKVCGEIMASDLGSTSTFRYQAECMPLGTGTTGMLTLLWLPDGQADLAISSPYDWWS